jgi:hypothetical protein
MLDCKIIVNEKEFSVEEFRAFVFENGLGGLSTEPLSPLAETLIERYDPYAQEPSLSEVWAALESQKNNKEVRAFQSQEEVDAALTAQGQLTDFSAQEQIRYNTYSGISLTGIAANFGKMFSYLLSTTPIESVIGPDNFVYMAGSTELNKVLVANKAATIEGLIQKNIGFRIQKREAVRLKDIFKTTVNGTTISGFSRLDEKQKNVFETIDTIINLAIDNVKMQKLHILGITNNNANLFLTFLGFGFPLNTVSRIFKTPAVTALSEGGRWTSEKLRKELVKLTDELIKDDNWQNRLYELYPEQADKLIGAVQKQKGISMAFGRLSIETSTLDSIYIGKTRGIDRLISDLVVLSNLRKLIPVGEELFTHSQVYSSLRGLPNKRWKVDSVIGKIERYTKFADESNRGAELQKVLVETLAETFRESAEYKAALEESEETAEKLLKERLDKYKENPDLSDFYFAQIRATFVNKILRRSLSRKIKPSDNSAFENSTPLRLPHVLAAYRALLLYKKILENSFFVYNPIVQGFINRFLNETNIFTPFDQLEKTDEVSKELIKYLSADLDFDVNGVPFSTSVPSDTVYHTDKKSYYGKEAWGQKFISSAGKVLSIDSSNEFLNALEIITNRDKVTKLQIVADKVSDEEMLELIREDFEKLIHNKEVIPGTETSWADFARDLFKYSLISDGMYFERTGLSLVFPAEWSIGYSNAQDARLEAVIPKDDARGGINLSLLKDAFTFQMLRSRPDLVRRNDTAPMTIANVKMSWGNKKIFHGTANYADKKIHFDLKFNVPFSDNSPRFIRLYGNEVYMLKNTPGSEYTYYVQLTEPGGSPHYRFSINDIDTAFSLDKLEFNGRIVNRSNIQGSTLTEAIDGYILEKGDTVAAFNRQDASGTELTIYEVTHARQTDTEYRYTLRFKSKVPLTKTEVAPAIRNLAGSFTSSRTGTTVVVDKIKEIREKALKRNNVIVSTSEIEEGIVLPLANITKDSTPEEVQAAVNKSITLLNEIPSSANVYVEKELLEPLTTWPNARRALARLVYKKTGFSDRYLPATLNHDTRFSEAQRRVELNIPRALGSVEVTFNEETKEHTIPSLREFSDVEVGQVVYLKENTYGYITDVTSQTFSVLMFDSKTFSAIEDGKLTMEEFTEVYKKINNC